MDTGSCRRRLSPSKQAIDANLTADLWTLNFAPRPQLAPGERSLKFLRFGQADGPALV
jgi:hypothetical protein